MNRQEQERITSDDLTIGNWRPKRLNNKITVRLDLGLSSGYGETLKASWDGRGIDHFTGRMTSDDRVQDQRYKVRQTAITQFPRGAP